MKSPRWLAGVLILTISPLLAQSTAPQSPVFRSGVDLVRLDVRVTDGEGRPIADLRPDEVQIKEAGTARPVLLFQHIEAPRGTYADAAQRTVAAQVSTNEGSPRGHVYVLVFDESHILPGHEVRARVAAEHFLRTRVQPGDRVALYALPGPGSQIDLTADVSRVLRELTAVRGVGDDTGTTVLGTMRTYEAYEIARGNQQILDRQADRMGQNRLATDARAGSGGRSNPSLDPDDPVAVRRAVLEDARAFVARADGETRRLLLGLADIVRTLRRVDGRKAVILFSEGFQIDHVTHELEEVAAAAAQSYSIIYSMDLNTPIVEASEETPRGGEQMMEVRDRLQSLGSLTAETGGTLVTNSAGQLDRALARIAETTEDYYLIGFAAGSRTRGEDHRYRRLQVNVTRPGAHVSTRTGYVLSPIATTASPRGAIDAALRAPFARQELRLEYTTYTLRGNAPGTQSVMVSLAAELPIASTGAALADVVYIVRDVDTGKVAASGSDRLPVPEAPQRAGGATGMALYRVQFELAPGQYMMRAVVREPGGLLGSADRRFEVRALNSPDVTASDLVLGSTEVSGLPVRAEASVSDVVPGVMELYARTEAQLERTSVIADLVSIAGGTAALSAHADLGPIKPTSVGFTRAVHVELPLENVTPGEYVVRATVRNGGDAVTELLRDVRIRSGPRAAITDAPTARVHFDPLDVLRGETVREFLEAIQVRAKGGALESAARNAVAGNWSGVEPALSQSSGGSVDECALRGMAAFARADYVAAISAFGAVHEGSQADATLAFVFGWAHAASGDDRAAITAWRNAIRASPSLVPAYLALVDVYVRLGHPELATQIVKSGLQAMPASPELLDRLARLERR